MAVEKIIGHSKKVRFPNKETGKNESILRFTYIF